MRRNRQNPDSPFAKNLRMVIAEKGLSQRKLAALAGVQPSTINDWLSGTLPTNLNPIVRLCQELKLDFQYLLTSTRSVPGRPDIELSEFFEIEKDATFEGIFMISARRLKKLSKP